MADAAVRVDIIVGQNSVVPAVERTTATLQGAQRSAAGLNGTFANLSNGGVRRLEAGFQALAFQAAGVPGPLGKIASGAVLLGGGSGVLLGVAVAAGAVALAWKAMAAEGEKLKTLLKDLNDLLPKNDPAATKVAEGWKRYGDMVREAGELERRGILTHTPLLVARAAALREQAAALKQTLDILAQTVTTMGGTDKPAGAGRAGKDSNLDYRMAVGLAGGPQIADLGDSVIALRETLIAPLEEMPEQVAAAFEGVNQEFLTGLSITSDFIDALNATLLSGIVDLGTALAEALGSGQSIGKVLVSALGKMMQQIGKLLIEFGVALVGLRPLLSNLFTSGPAMIAAGVLIAAAGAAVSKAATGGQVSSRSASGGVDSNRYQNDQQAIAARGTVTVSMKGGFIDPRSPEFQEFLAQVIKEAKGRNVVFA